MREVGVISSHLGKRQRYAKIAYAESLPQSGTKHGRDQSFVNVP